MESQLQTVPRCPRCGEALPPHSWPPASAVGGFCPRCSDEFWKQDRAGTTAIPPVYRAPDRTGHRDEHAREIAMVLGK